MADLMGLVPVLSLLEVALVEPTSSADSPVPLGSEEALGQAETAISSLRDGPDDEAVASLQELLDFELPKPVTQHPTMIFARELLAFRLYGEGRYAEGLQQFEEVAQIKTESFGSDHPLTLQNKFNIGIVKWSLGQHEEACQVVDETYRVQEKVNPLLHRGTLSTMENLAFMYHFSGRSWEAQGVQKKVLDLRLQHSPPPDDSDLLKSSILLATIYSDMEWWKEAENAYRLVVEGRTALQGADSLATAASTANLIQVIQRQGRLDEAEKLCNEIIERLTNSTGPESLPTLRNRFHLSSILCDKGDYVLAADLQKEILETEKRLYGDDDENALNTMSGLIETLRKLSSFDEAEKLLKESISIREKMLGPHHPALLLYRIELGALYSEMDLWDKAESIIDCVVVDWLQSPARNDEDLYDSLKGITSLLLQHGKISAWNRFTFGESL